MCSSPPINEELLRLLGQHLSSLSVIAHVRYFPTEKADRVIAQLASSYYPDHIETARLELRFRVNGDFNVYYGEAWDAERWACRWDQHPNTHNSREHFHPPPQPEETTAIDAVYPSEPEAVLRRILETVERRINLLWTATTDPIYPAEYEFSGEFGEICLS